MKSVLHLLSGIAIFFCSTHASAQSVPRATDPGRVKIIVNQHGKTLVRSDGKTMRGGAVWVWKAPRVDRPEEYKITYDESWYKMMADNGINAIRIIEFDPWMSWYGPAADPWPITDFKNEQDVKDLFFDLDTVINLASKYNMVVMINFHAVGRYKGEYKDETATTYGYLKDFWKTIAPRYKDRSHVFYELMNEPVGWWPSSYSNEDLRVIKEIYDIVHTAAPKTHISLFSFANMIETWSNPIVTMKDVADKMNSLAGMAKTTAQQARSARRHDTQRQTIPGNRVAVHVSRINLLAFD